MGTGGMNGYRWYEWVQVVGASLGGGKAIGCRQVKGMGEYIHVLGMGPGI